MPKRTGKKDQVRVEFEGDLKSQFEAVRLYYGIKANADVIRALITEKYHIICKEN